MANLSTSHYWKFARDVRLGRRFIHSESTREFLQHISASAERRVDTVPADSFLWRAQKGGDKAEMSMPDTDDTYEVDCPFPPHRMKPLVCRAFEGRANPKGLPYLYLATERDVAVAEVRPWKGVVVSVAQFRVLRELRIVNTTLLTAQRLNILLPSDSDRDPSDVEEWVWGDISRAFSEPTQPSDDSADYIPTQILAELFRHDGFDAVAYRSAYGPGHNLVVFDMGLVEQVNCHIVRVNDVHFDLTTDIQYGYEL